MMGIVLGWPVPGFYRVTSGFRTAGRPNHQGIDIGRNIDPARAIDGACVVAPADGRVSGAGAGHESMGGWLMIDHGGGLATRYMHNRANLVGVGDYVLRGEGIALVGNTGRSTAPHLHFEVILDGAHVDPMGFFGSSVGACGAVGSAVGGAGVNVGSGVEAGAVGGASFLAGLLRALRALRRGLGFAG